MEKKSKLFRHGAAKTDAMRAKSKKAMLLSIVSLMLVFAGLMTSTFCWFSLKRAEGHTNNYVSLSVGKGLRVNDMGDTMKNISDCSYLLPASSVDGRNLYFPADGLPFTNKTDDKMVFRMANAGDMNRNYVQLNFSLTAEADYTSIFFKKGSTIRIKTVDENDADETAGRKKAERAIRAAIFYEGIEDNKPIVFSPRNKSVSTMAVNEIDRTSGYSLTRKKQVAVPFNDYTYGKRTLATLNKGETRRFSLLVWLEGTDETNCTSVPLMLKELEIDLTFTTSWDNTHEIQFVDKNKDLNISSLIDSTHSLVLNYNNEAHKVNNYQFVMYKKAQNDTDDIWYCNIPGNAVNDITFLIVDDTKKNSESGRIVYEWSKNTGGRSTTNRGTATVYIADSVNSINSRGHWYDGDIEGGGYGGGSGEAGDGW